MKEEIKRMSPAVYVVILICFFLPFTHISCAGERIATLTGLQLVTGTTIEESLSASFGEKEESKKIHPEPLALLTLIIAIIGFGVSSFKGRKSSLLAALIGGLGLVSLLCLKAKIDNEVLREGEGILRVEYGFGFWLILLLFLFAIGLNGFLFSEMKKEDLELIEPN